MNDEWAVKELDVFIDTESRYVQDTDYPREVKEELIALAEAIAKCLCGQHEHLCLMLIRHLADGHPVSIARQPS